MIKVLIAEDDFRVAQIHEQYLEQIEEMELAGKAMNAKETLRLLKENHIDLLLLDVYMPDMLGTELLQKIRDGFSVDIIMITAANEKAFIKKALDYGVKQYLVKPVTIERFKEVMNQYSKNREILNSMDTVNQEILDRLFGVTEKKAIKQKLPSGIDYITLKKVTKILSDEREGITAENVAERMGASRSTARRYLEYMVGVEQAVVEQVYGIVGRPERRYYLKI